MGCVFNQVALTRHTNFLGILVITGFLMALPVANGALPFFRAKRPPSLDRTVQDERAAELMALAESAEAAGNRREALSYYEEVPKKYWGSKHSPEALYRIAKIRFEQRKWKKSFAAFNNVITYYPDYDKFNLVLTEQFEIASALMDNKTSRYFGVIPYHHYDNAVGYFEVIIRNAPYSDYAPLALMNVGIIHKKRKDHRYAIDAFDRLINTYPRSLLAPEAYLELADTFASLVDGSQYDQGATEEAIRYFQDFMILFPESPRIAEAEIRLNEMQELFSRSKLEIAEFYLKKRKYYPGAKQFFNEAITVAPNSQSAEAARGYLAELPDEEEEALVAVAEAKALNSGKKRGILRRINPFGRKRRDSRRVTEKEVQAAEIAESAPVENPEEEPEPTLTDEQELVSGVLSTVIAYEKSGPLERPDVEVLTPVIEVPSPPIRPVTERDGEGSEAAGNDEVAVSDEPTKREVRREEKRLKRERKKEEANAAAAVEVETEIVVASESESSIGEITLDDEASVTGENADVVVAEAPRVEAGGTEYHGNSIGEFVYFDIETGTLEFPVVDRSGTPPTSEEEAPSRSGPDDASEASEEEREKKGWGRTLLFWKKNRADEPEEQTAVE